MSARRRICLLLLIAITVASAARAQEPKELLSLDDFLEWEEVENPLISPDGQQIIYTRKSVDAITDRWRSELRIVNADGTQDRFLVNGAWVAWSPDGTRIAYTAPGEPRGRQIFVRLMDGAGTTTQITHVEHTPWLPRWSPDGESIAFAISTPRPREPWDLEMPSPPPDANWVAAPRVEGVGYPRGEFDHMYVVSADGGTPRALTEGAWWYDYPEWSRDGSTLFVSGEPASPSGHLEIYAIDMASREARRLTSHRGWAGRPKVSPDGRLVAYLVRAARTTPR